MLRRPDHVRAELETVRADAEKVLLRAEAESRNLTDKENAEIEKAYAQIETLREEFESAVKAQRIRSDEMMAKHGRPVFSNDNPFDVKWLKGSQGNSPWNSEETKQVSMFVKGLITGDDRLVRNAMGTGSNPNGGFLVPDPLAARIVELRNLRGVARRFCEVVPMTSNSLSVPKITGEIVSHYVDENTEIPESTPTVAQISLVAKKLAALIPMSNELDEDAIISVAEMLARSIAYEFAGREDEALFNGDGTSNYGSIEGLSTVLAAGSRYTATGQTTFGALTFGSFETVIGKCKRYMSSEEPRWYFSRAGYYASARRLMNAAGGNDLSSLSMTDGEQKFMGFDVTLSDAIHSNLGTSTGSVACYFGDLRGGVMMGARKEISVKADASAGFSKDQLWIRGIERYDLVAHDRGTASESGGIVALVFG